MPRLLYPRERDPVPTVQQAAWAPRIRPEGYGNSSSHWDLTASIFRIKIYVAKHPEYG
jgi:hypothetical protein